MTALSLYSVLSSKDACAAALPPLVRALRRSCFHPPSVFPGKVHSPFSLCWQTPEFVPAARPRRAEPSHSLFWGRQNSPPPVDFENRAVERWLSSLGPKKPFSFFFETTFPRAPSPFFLRKESFFFPPPVRRRSTFFFLMEFPSPQGFSLVG